MRIVFSVEKNYCGAIAHRKRPSHTLRKFWGVVGIDIPQQKENLVYTHLKQIREAVVVLWSPSMVKCINIQCGQTSQSSLLSRPSPLVSRGGWLDYTNCESVFMAGNLNPNGTCCHSNMLHQERAGNQESYILVAV